MTPVVNSPENPRYASLWGLIVVMPRVHGNPASIMHKIAILYPIFALALWTSLVLVQIPIARFRSACKREIVVDDLKYGESASVPAHVSIPNRNYMNLLELPVLFYVVCLLIYITGGASQAMVTIAWAYVALRVLHSVIHLSYNHVIHRFIAFAASNAVLIALWVLAALKVFPDAPA